MDSCPITEHQNIAIKPFWGGLEREVQRNTGIRLSNLADWHRKVYKEQSTQATDQEIAGAAAFEAIRMYIQQCKSKNTPISDTQASSSIASLVTQEVRFVRRQCSAVQCNVEVLTDVGKIDCKAHF